MPSSEMTARPMPAGDKCSVLVVSVEASLGHRSTVRTKLTPLSRVSLVASMVASGARFAIFRTLAIFLALGLTPCLPAESIWLTPA